MPSRGRYRRGGRRTSRVGVHPGPVSLSGDRSGLGHGRTIVQASLEVQWRRGSRNAAAIEGAARAAPSGAVPLI